MAAALRLMVNERRERRPHVAQASLAHAQAEIDVVKGDHEILVEAAHREIRLLADEQARGGNRGEILREPRAALVAGSVGTQVLVAVADAQDDSRMLDRAIGIEQPRADRTHLGAQRVREHFLEPAGVDDLEVVVQQAHHVSVRLRDGEVVQGREVEWADIAQDARSTKALEASQVVEGRRIAALVIDDEQFIISITGLREQRLYARLQQLVAIARRDDQAD